MKRHWLTLLLVSKLATLFAQTDDLQKDTLAFGNWLFQQGEYMRAATEYYRYLYYGGQENAWLWHQLALCYFKAGEYQKALTIYNRLIKSFPLAEPKEDIFYEAAFANFKIAEFEECIKLIDELALQQDLLPPFFILRGSAYLLLGKDNQAVSDFTTYLAFPDAMDRVKVENLLELINKSAKENRLNPFLAGLFSSLIPGLGRIYAGRTEDGLVSFLLVGGCAALAFYSFSREGTNSLAGWIYVGLGSLFYISNIWGSVVAAEQANGQQLAKRNWELKERLHALFP